MDATPTSLDGLLELFSQCLDAESSQRVSQFKIYQTVQTRLDTLADLANNGILSQDEAEEYESLINASDLISVLKLKASRQLDAAL